MTLAESTALKECAMDLWTSPAERPEPFGPCGQPMDNVRVAHRLPTLSGLSPTSSTAPTNSERNIGENCQ